MAIQLPENQQQVQLQKTPTQQLQNEKSAQIDLGFLKPISQAVNARLDAEAKRLKKLKADQDRYTLKRHQNDLRRSAVEAKAIVANAEGKNATPAIIEQKEKLKKTYTDINSKYSEKNPHLVNDFDIQTRNADLDFDTTAIPHEVKQLSKVRKETYDINTKDAMDSAIEYSPNKQAFAVKLKEVAEKAAESSILQYGNAPEIVREASEKAVSNTVLSAIQLRAGTAPSSEVKDMFETFMNVMQPADREKAQKILDKSVEDNSNDLAFQLASRAQALYPDDYASQSKFIQASADGDGEIVKKTNYFLDHNLKVQKQQKKEREDEKLAQAFEKINTIADSGGAMTSEIYKSLSPADQSAALTFIEKRGNIDSDPEVIETLDSLHTKDEEAFVRAVRVSKLRLSRKDRTHYTSLARNILNADKSDKNRRFRQTDKVVADITNSYLEPRGLSGTNLSDKDLKLKFAIKEKVRSMYSDIKGDEKLSDQQIRDAIMDGLKKSDIKIEPTKVQKSFLWWDYESEGPEEVTGLESAKPVIPKRTEMHRYYKDRIINSFWQQEQRLPTAAEISVGAEKLKERGIDITAEPVAR